HGGPPVEKEDKDDERHQQNAFNKVFAYGVHGGVDKLGAVDERLYFYILREDPCVQIVYLVFQKLYHLARVLSPEQHHEAFAKVVFVLQPYLSEAWFG